MTYEKLQRLLKEEDCFRTRGASGVPYQIAVEAVWDNKPGETCASWCTLTTAAFEPSFH